MLAIGFAGYAQSGKDTAAKAICDPRYILEASRDVKAGLLMLDPWVDVIYRRHRPDGSKYTEQDAVRLSILVDAYGWEAVKQYPEVRRLLQVYGTECGRQVHGDDCWVSKLRATLTYWGNMGVPLACVTGIRFANEATLCNRLIWVERPGRGEGEHRSERLEAIRSMADHTLVNDGTEAEWAERVRKFFKEVKA